MVKGIYQCWVGMYLIGYIYGGLHINMNRPRTLRWKSFLKWSQNIRPILKIIKKNILTLQDITLSYNVKVCLRNFIQNMSCLRNFPKNKCFYNTFKKPLVINALMNVFKSWFIGVNKKWRIFWSLVFNS